MNKYLTLLPGAKTFWKIGVTELNDILLNRMPNSRSKKTHVEGFYCEAINFKKAVNMIEYMEIA